MLLRKAAALADVRLPVGHTVHSVPPASSSTSSATSRVPGAVDPPKATPTVSTMKRLVVARTSPGIASKAVVVAYSARARERVTPSLRITPLVGRRRRAARASTAGGWGAPGAPSNIISASARYPPSIRQLWRHPVGAPALRLARPDGIASPE